MSAWGTEPFDNDDVAEWTAELSEGDLRSQLFAAVAAAADWPEDELLEIPDGVSAVAAAQVIAYLLGRDKMNQTEHTADVLGIVNQQRFTPDKELIQEAVAALSRVQGEESELKELWAESKHYDDWKSVVERVKQALSA